MKASILSPQLEISQDSHLGGTVTDREVLYRLADRSYRIIVLLPEGEKYKPHPMIRVKYIPRNIMLKKSYKANFFFLKDILKVIKEEKIDILRVHSPYSIGIGISILKMFNSLPPIWFSFLHMHRRLDWRLLDAILPHFADGITALSDDTLSDLRARFRWVDKKITKVTPLGIDTNIFYRISRPELKELPDTNGIDPTRPLVLFVGRLVKEKGIKFLLDSWKIISARHRGAQLLIIGKGELEDRVRRFCKRNENTHYLDYVPQHRLPNYYSAADVFAFPTFKEGFGMATGEAMACQTPVVITNISGVRNLVVDGVTGFLVAPSDKTTFSQRIIYLIEHKDITTKMGKAARERIKSLFSWEKAIDCVEEFIDEILDKKPERT